MRKLVALLLLTCAAALAGSTFKSSGPAAHGSQATISFVNASTVAKVASGDLTLNAPSSPQVDDVWIATIYSTTGGPSSFTDWTAIGSNSNVATYYFRYNGATPNLTVTWGISNSATGIISVFRNCRRVSSPVNVSSALEANVGTTITIPGITPTAPGCMLVASVGTNDDNTYSNDPAGFTQIYEDTNLAGNPDSSMGVYYKLHTTGATGDFTQTLNESDGWIAKLIALEPR